MLIVKLNFCIMNTHENIISMQATTKKRLFRDQFLTIK